MGKTKEPSEEFLQALEHSHSGGGCRADCQFCGRITYDSSGIWDWDEGELEDLNKRNDEDSDKVIAVDYAVPIAYLDGKQYVIGCPCNSGRKYEDWIWNHRDLIAEYFNLRTKRILDESKREVKLNRVVQQAMKILVLMSEAAEEAGKRLMSLGKRAVRP